MKTIFNSIIICIAFCSCNRQTSDFFSSQREIYGEAITVDCLIGRPAEIVCIDSFLFFYDRYEGQTITVLDIKNDRFISRFLNEGQGPDEVLVPLKLSVSGGKKLIVFQMQNGLLREYDLSGTVDMEQKALYGEYSFEDRPANIKKTAGGFVGIGMFEDGRYTLYDENGKAVNTVGKYPFRGEKMSPAERFFLYQGALCVSPDGSHFAMGSSYCDNLEFYRIENGDASLVRRYETYDVAGNFDRQVSLSDNCVMNYKGACGTERYCYMLYSGETFGTQHVRSTGGKLILVFDWKGAHVQTLASDKLIYSFCVDAADETLYAITYEEEEGFSITRYKL
ncbi:MAG: TolB-like 6-bladed beta-propeller domain-containing protein [Prevotellaceae bacterium]|nr:TolB-like 6-bladed beta-propeller domain-containing protein [Prevotellaceae bacterium]